MSRSMQEILDQADALAEAFENYEPNPADHRDPAPLIALREAVSARAHAEANLAEAVTEARRHGYSWTSIGALLGTSEKQHANATDPTPKPPSKRNDTEL